MTESAGSSVGGSDPDLPGVPDAAFAESGARNARNLEESRRSDQLLETAAQRDAVARFTIARIVVWTWAIVVGAIVLILAGAAVHDGNYPGFYAQALDVLKIAVIPVVTYVLGYYSARSSR